MRTPQPECGTTQGKLGSWSTKYDGYPANPCYILQILTQETKMTRAIYRRDQHPEKAWRFEEVVAGKVKLLCETRRVERHNTLDEFREMSEDILDCLTAILNHEGNKWGSKTMTGAVGLLCAISSSTFIFHVNRCMFEYTVGLSQLPQGSTQDILRLMKKSPW